MTNPDTMIAGGELPNQILTHVRPSPACRCNLTVCYLESEYDYEENYIYTDGVYDDAYYDDYYGTGGNVTPSFISDQQAFQILRDQTVEISLSSLLKVSSTKVELVSLNRVPRPQQKCSSPFLAQYLSMMTIFGMSSSR